MSETREIPVPDIGDFEDVEIIEVLISPGDTIAPEDSLITLESDKASMEIPAPEGGTVKEVRVKVGDRVSEGDTICTIEPAESGATGADDSGGEEDDTDEEKPAGEEQPETKEASPPEGRTEAAPETPPPPQPPSPQDESRLREEDAAPPDTGPRPSPTAHIEPEKHRSAHASPSVRRLARELGVDLTQVQGSGRKGRILHDDVKAFVKRTMQAPATGAGLGVTPMPDIDFSEFGEIETQALTKINRLTGQNLHRNWVTIPHVTQFDEVDITELERFRKELNEEHQEDGIRITLVSFLLKAVVSALREFPRFNSSLDTAGENLVIKKYYHIGVAVDTKDGLVVPVIRDVDRKNLTDLAAELMDVSEAARNKKLSPAQMKGGCFSISSLGGIGGTAFTPIVNAPEVAILGVSRAQMKPVYMKNGEFEPRLMLPLSLTYDHRVIDGADGARFTTYLGKLLSDMRRMLL